MTNPAEVPQNADPTEGPRRECDSRYGKITINGFGPDQTAQAFVSLSVGPICLCLRLHEARVLADALRIVTDETTELTVAASRGAA